VNRKLDLLGDQVLSQNKRINQLETKVNTQATQLKMANEQIETLLQLLSVECPNSNNTRRKRCSKQQTTNRKRSKRSSSLTNRMARIEKNKISMRSAVRQSKQAQTQFRSCHEIFLAYGGQTGQALHSLMPCKNRTKDMFYFHIDPDGQGIGAPPIYVLCDFTNGISF